jgi:serine protease inhibitor
MKRHDRDNAGLVGARLGGQLIPLMLMLSIGSSRTAEAEAARTQALADGNTAFALDLYREFKTTPGNLFFSPYSISTSLAMTWAGARGDTQTQMARVLHFPGQEREVHAPFGEIQRRLNDLGKSQGIELSVANGLWAQEDRHFLPAFLNLARGEYQANISSADFQTKAPAVREEINRWVAQKTRDKIQDILPPGSVNHLTRLVLANAIYFKGQWAHAYAKSETASKPFHLSSAREIVVPLMHRLDSFRYTENSEFQAVELPYKNDQLAMVVLLPRQVDGCGQLESRLDTVLLARSLSELKPQKVEVFLPRFKLESRFDLKQTLAKMGMPDAFGPKADFSGMDGTRLLNISDVFHKAWGEVNEEGTEAAAATAVVVLEKMAVAKPPPPPPVFRADHPFLFLIRDTRSGTLLFLGRMVDPS